MLKFLILLLTFAQAASPPVITAPAQTTIAQSNAKIISNISIAETGAAPTLSYTVVLAANAGLLAATGSATITGSGTNALTVKGTVAQVNATLATLTFTGSINDQINITTVDANSQSAAPAQIAVNVLSNANTYLIYATQALALARSQQQCATIGCDGVNTIWWWNVIGPTNAGTISATAIAANSYAVEIQPNGRFAATTNQVTACAIGCGLTTVEQGALVTAAQLVTVMP